MSYSFDTKTSSRWDELADGYQSMLDELNNELPSDVFIPVANFDVDEVL
jgi:hypothetical protein